MEVTAWNARGVQLHTTSVGDLEEARAYCNFNSRAGFVHGFSVEGYGIYIVRRDALDQPIGYRSLLGGSFVEGGDELIGQRAEDWPLSCAYCNALVSDEPVPAIDDEAWESASYAHHNDCEWVLTRAHRMNVGGGLAEETKS